MVETIVVSTNMEGVKQKGAIWKVVTRTELWAFIGLMISRGVYRSSGESIEELWSKSCGRPIFSATMTLQRFVEIKRMLRFDNKDSRNARLRNDKMAANRILLDGFNSNAKAAYRLGECVTIDEQLYPFRGRCRYVQYIPSNPAKYGLKFWLLCDSTTYYIHSMEMYTGQLMLATFA